MGKPIVTDLNPWVIFTAVMGLQMKFFITWWNKLQGYKFTHTT